MSTPLGLQLRDCLFSIWCIRLPTEDPEDNPLALPATAVPILSMSTHPTPDVLLDEEKKGLLTKKALPVFLELVKATSTPFLPHETVSFTDVNSITNLRLEAAFLCKEIFGCDAIPGYSFSFSHGDQRHTVFIDEEVSLLGIQVGSTQFVAKNREGMWTYHATDTSPSPADV